MITDAVNANQFAAELMVEELARLGVDTFFVAPGSRSSPLVIAAARHPSTRCVIHFDERGTAFAALGYGRARQTPAAWITTSGTAVANGLPAIVESASDGVPLLAITADRPVELRRTGANQTIDQPGIFGRYVRWQMDLPPWAADTDPSYVLTTIDQAVHRSIADAGPVHLNLMFGEPLAPVVDRSFELPHVPVLYRWLERDRPFTQYDQSWQAASSELVEEILDAVTEPFTGVVVAGRLRSPDEGRAVAALAEHLCWPLLADVLSFAHHSAAAVRHYDALLATSEFSEALRPHTIVHFGGRATSKRLYEHLAEHPPERLVLVSSFRDRIDPVHRVTHRIEADVATVCRQIMDLSGRSVSGAGSHAALAGFERLQNCVESVLSECLGDSAKLTEPWVARHIAHHLPESHELFVGSSMPIRDVDTFAGSSGILTVRANRGASGIDGTVASAVGVATGRSGPVTLLLGDLALLHDLNSLSLVRSCDQPVIAIVVNNDGGGIFSFLPVADFPAVFETCFGAPHGLTFESAAAMFDLPYHFVDSTEAFADAYEALCRSDTSGLIEVRTDREENQRFHGELMRTIREAIAEPVGAESPMSARSG